MLELLGGVAFINLVFHGSMFLLWVVHRLRGGDRSYKAFALDDGRGNYEMRSGRTSGRRPPRPMPPVVGRGFERRDGREYKVTIFLPNHPRFAMELPGHTWSTHGERGGRCPPHGVLLLNLWRSVSTPRPGGLVHHRRMKLPCPQR